MYREIAKVCVLQEVLGKFLKLLFLVNRLVTLLSFPPGYSLLDRFNCRFFLPSTFLPLEFTFKVLFHRFHWALYLVFSLSSRILIFTAPFASSQLSDYTQAHCTNRSLHIVALPFLGVSVEMSANLNELIVRFYSSIKFKNGALPGIFVVKSYRSYLSNSFTRFQISKRRLIFEIPKIFLWGLFNPVTYPIQYPKGHPKGYPLFFLPFFVLIYSI